jgi:hypothetical protein
MNTARIRMPAHKPLKLLPWYVNRTLEPQEDAKVAAHVRNCPICQREVNDLAKLFAKRARTVPPRPVNEARLDEVFARIDRYEAERGRQARRPEPSRSLRESALAWVDWLIARPALPAAVAALVLAVIAVPMLMPRAVDKNPSYTVLSDSNTVGEPWRVRLRFQAATEPAVAERTVKASLGQQKLANPFKLERQPNGDYLVIFEQKPSIAAMSRLLDDLRHAPNVADVAIDDG